MDLPAGRMHYVDEGTGEPILFVPWHPDLVLRMAAPHSGLRPTHRCIAPDHLGFGFSDRPRDFSYTPEAHAENLERFVESSLPALHARRP
jgi:haloalkane dehalogenase